MKNHFLLGIAILCMISVLAQNQTHLLNREVYGFEPGDVIHVSISCVNCITQDSSHNQRYLKRNFISKQYSANEDTVFYEVQDSLFVLTSQPGWRVIVTNPTLVYHSLDSVVKPWGQTQNDLYLDFEGYDTITLFFEYEQKSTQPSPSIQHIFSPTHSFSRDMFLFEYFENFGSYLRINNYEGVSVETKLLFVKRNEVLMGAPIADLLTHKQLLNRDIYNFEPGDVIHFRETPPSIETNRTVLTKHFSPNQDTVFYEVLDTVVTHTSMGITMEIFNRTLSYTRLDEVPHGYLDFHFSEHAGTVRKRYEFGGNRWSYTEYYYEGLGQFYQSFSSSGIWSRSNEVSLVYYKKGGQEWGTPLSTYDVESPSKSDFILFPNPASQQVFLKRDESLSQALIEVYTATGVLIVSFEWEKGLQDMVLDCSEWVAGSYYVTYQANNEPRKTQKCIITR